MVAASDATGQARVEVASFLLRVEAAALAPESLSSSGLLSLTPEGLHSDFAEECRSLLRLLQPARAGDISTVLSDPWMAPLASVLTRARVDGVLANASTEQLFGQLSVACEEFVSQAPHGCEELRRYAVMLVAISSLQLFLRVNWTGPPLVDDGKMPFTPDVPMCVGVKNPAASALLLAMEVDGEMVYELVPGAGYLWLAAAILGILPSTDGASAPVKTSVAAGRTLSVWRGRCAFVWQLCITDANERGFGHCLWLFRLAVHDLVGTEQAGGVVSKCGIPDAVVALARKTTEPMVQACDPKALPQSCISAVTPWAAGVGTEDGKEQRGGSDGGGSSVGGLDDFPVNVRMTLFLEFVIRLCWYGKSKDFREFLDAACDLVGIAFKLTGVEGIKRKFQTTAFSQLAVKVWSKPPLAQKVETEVRDEADEFADAMAALSGCVDEDDEPAQVSGDLKLSQFDDMTDILERPKWEASKEDQIMLERPLTTLEQVVIMSNCSFLWGSSNQNDEMILQEVNAYAQRVLASEEKPTAEQSATGGYRKSEASVPTVNGSGDAEADGSLLTANWLTYRCGLYFRSCAEHHRNKTRERASFQVQALVDQYKDERPSAAHRLLLVHTTDYPSRFRMQRELGMRMMKMGMVSTAFEEFKRLRMWSEAVDCLAVAERNVEAEELVRDLLREDPTPRLWCCLGDLQKEPQHYTTAWELSGGRYARAQRSLGRGHFYKGEYAKAVDSFKLSLAIAPLNHGIWFMMGVAEMKLERWESALSTFVRCVGIEMENAQSWANLAGSHSALGHNVAAQSCMEEACKLSRENWRFWDTYLAFSLKLRDIQACINALRQLANLEQFAMIKERVVGMLTVTIICDKDGLSDTRTGMSFAKNMESLFAHLTSKNASMPFVWRFFAELQEKLGKQADSIESRFKQVRATQATLWDEVDPDRFGERLTDLCDCFQTLDEVLGEPSVREIAASRWQPLAYSVRNAERQLQEKVDAATKSPILWKEALEKLTQLAAKLEAYDALNGTEDDK
eukprot:TRINITY_DN28553_c0_g1_i1.p1 TRINITY_DN28553_c0_g1~~TRINITY_DN28553_c0_g1_i1.p1  ORF type:complete len:1054 (-),score=163.17 TRINITY_DN28553_c0_g1_i1:176-3241(-)